MGCASITKICTMLLIQLKKLWSLIRDTMFMFLLRKGEDIVASKNKIDQEVIDKIVSFLENMEYGTVQITVHDSQVTQIEKGEKYRFALKKNNKPLKTVKDE